jgi:serine/threonine-protein kinase
MDHRADLYSLGIVAYEMLVGTPPFQGRTPQALLAAQLTEPPPPIESRRYDVPEALAALITRCLAKDAAERPRSAEEVVRALDDPSVIGGTVKLRPIAESAKRGKRMRAIVWFVILAALLAGVATWAHSCATQRSLDEALGQSGHLTPSSIASA